MQIIQLIRNNCPVCHKGKVYQRNNLASFGHDEMNTECAVCKTSFTKDPGFYWGSMYVSYGLSMLDALLAYFICRTLGTEKYDYVNLIAAIMAILICSALITGLPGLVDCICFLRTEI